jgi:hypothetical protein
MWQAAEKNSTLYNGDGPHTTKIGVGSPEMIQKGEPCTGYNINLRSGATGKKMLLKIVAFEGMIRIR